MALVGSFSPSCFRMKRYPFGYMYVFCRCPVLGLISVIRTVPQREHERCILYISSLGRYLICFELVMSPHLCSNALQIPSLRGRTIHFRTAIDSLSCELWFFKN